MYLRSNALSDCYAILPPIHINIFRDKRWLELQWWFGVGLRCRPPNFGMIEALLLVPLLCGKISLKPSLDDILRATGGVLPSLAIRHCWKHLQHMKQLGPMLLGNTVPCFMEQSCIVCTILMNELLSKERQKNRIKLCLKKSLGDMLWDNTGILLPSISWAFKLIAEFACLTYL